MPVWRALATAMALLFAVCVQAAEKLKPIDAEFLEYLAELEGADDDWTLFEEAKEQPQRPARDASKSEESAPKKPAADKPPADK